MPPTGAATESIISTRVGGQIFVAQQGSGPSLVWVAGLGDDHTGWAAQIKEFAAEYTCVSFDRRPVCLDRSASGPSRRR